MATQESGMFGDLFGGGVEALGALDQITRIRDIGDDARGEMEEIGQSAIDQTAFKPFGVTSGIANTSVQPDGSIDIGLTDQQQQFADSRFDQSNALFNAASADQTQRERGMFDEIIAAQQPGREREMLALESRLAAQGRLGAGSAAYGGGNAQMFGLQQANREADMQALTQARNFAQTQQRQDAELGGLFQSAGYQPTQVAANLLTPATQIANIGNSAQIAGANLDTQANITGLESQIQSEKIAADMIAGLYGQAAGMAGQFGSAIDSSGQSASDFIVDKIKEWF